MRPTKAREFISHMLRTRRPLYIWGPPGVGKSDLVREAAADAKREVVDVRCALLDPVDLRGLPRVDNGITRWCPPCFLPSAPKSTAVVFLDELAQAPTLVQSACMQLFIDRRLGEYQVPEGVSIVAASNRVEDRAGAHRVITPILNRCVHIDVETSTEDWLAWALARGVHHEIRSFVAFRPQLLHAPDKTGSERAWPTPRAWHALSDVLTQGSPVEDMDLAAGCVGPGAAAEFVAHRAIASRLPSPAKVLASPEASEIPSEPSVIYAMCGALVEHLRTAPKDIEAFCTYVTRMPAEYAALAMKDGAAVVGSKITATRAGAAWIRANRDVITGGGR